MDIPMIINTIINYASIVLAIMAGLVFVTNIIVEVLKVFLPKLPTNYLAVIVAIAITVLALYILAAVMQITVMWYYAVGAVVLGIFVAYASMFGLDKFKEVWEKLQMAMKVLSDQLAEKNIKITGTEMKLLIEAAVAEFNEAFKKPVNAEDTAKATYRVPEITE